MVKTVEKTVSERIGKEIKNDYSINDVKALYDSAHPKNWDDAIRWLGEHAVAEDKLSLPAADKLKEDLVRLEEAGAPFLSNYSEAYEEAKKNRVE